MHRLVQQSKGVHGVGVCASSDVHMVGYCVDMYDGMRTLYLLLWERMRFLCSSLLPVNGAYGRVHSVLRYGCL